MNILFVVTEAKKSFTSMGRTLEYGAVPHLYHCMQSSYMYVVELKGACIRSLSLRITRIFPPRLWSQINKGDFTP